VSGLATSTIGARAVREHAAASTTDRVTRRLANVIARQDFKERTAKRSAIHGVLGRTARSPAAASNRIRLLVITSAANASAELNLLACVVKAPVLWDFTGTSAVISAIARTTLAAIHRPENASVNVGGSARRAIKNVQETFMV